MDPGGTSWQRNIPVPLEVVYQHEETENEILETWDRYEAMKARWGAENTAVTPHGDILFEDENWQEVLPRVRELLVQELAEAEREFQRPVMDRFQAMEQNIRLQIHVHEAIPKSEILQVEIGNGPLPFVQYSRALRSLRNFAAAAREQTGGQWDAKEVFQKLPEPEVDLEAMLEGRMETPEETAQWQDAQAGELLGRLGVFSGATEQRALREIHLRHVEPDQVDEWVFQSTRLHILLSALRSPFDDLNQEFLQARNPEEVRPVEELVEEAKKLRESIVGQSEDLILDGKAAEFRSAYERNRFFRSRLRARDIITHRGVILTPYEEYLVLHYTIKYAELVQGRAFMPSFAELRPLTATEAAASAFPRNTDLVRDTAAISPLPLPFTPKTSFAILLDYIRLQEVAKKLRQEHVEISARHNDPNWLLQREEARVERLRQVREARANNPLYTELFGRDAPEKALEFHPAPDSFLDPVPAGLLQENLIAGESKKTEHMTLEHLFQENAPRYPEGIDILESQRDNRLEAAQELRQFLDGFDLAREDYEAYKELHTALLKVRFMRWQMELDSLRAEFQRRDMIEAISRQTSDLHPRFLN